MKNVLQKFIELSRQKKQKALMILCDKCLHINADFASIKEYIGHTTPQTHPDEVFVIVYKEFVTLGNALKEITKEQKGKNIKEQEQKIRKILERHEAEEKRDFDGDQYLQEEMEKI